MEYGRYQPEIFGAAIFVIRLQRTTAIQKTGISFSESTSVIHLLVVGSLLRYTGAEGR